MAVEVARSVALQKEPLCGRLVRFAGVVWGEKAWAGAWLTAVKAAAGRKHFSWNSCNQGSVMENLPHLKRYRVTHGRNTGN